MTLDTHEIAQLNRHFEDTAPTRIIEWAVNRFMPSIVATSSFQSQSVALLHIISLVRSDLPVVFLDTGYHFPETLAYRDRLVERFGLTLRIIQPSHSMGEEVQRHGDVLYRRDPDLCCQINKVAPMQRVLEQVDAWISGIRRDQTSHRANAQTIETFADGRVKINPLISWDHRTLWSYIHKHDLPIHPLFSKGYVSIGCAPCTMPIARGMDERAGRWKGKRKIECGLHTNGIDRELSKNPD